VLIAIFLIRFAHLMTSITTPGLRPSGEHALPHVHQARPAGDLLLRQGVLHQGLAHAQAPPHPPHLQRTLYAAPLPPTHHFFGRVRSSFTLCAGTATNISFSHSSTSAADGTCCPLPPPTAHAASSGHL
jgi:hypothetical protein